MPLTSSPRPRARPSNNVTSSPRPRARPSNNVTSSPRPQARPSNNVTSSPRPQARPSTSSSRTGGGGFLSGNEKGFSRSGGGGGRSLNNVGGNPAQESSPTPRPRPSVKPDNSLLLNRQGQQRMKSNAGGSYRGAVLSNLYQMPADGTRAVRSLQAFNGPRGGRTVLGQ